MPIPRRRRWYQFGIGTMLLLVTVFATFLAYHVNWIRQRHAFLAEEQRRCEAVGLRQPEFVDATVRAPGLLPWFGEPGLVEIDLFLEVPIWEATGTDEVRVQEASRLFPEAMVASVGMPEEYNGPAPLGGAGYAVTLTGEVILSGTGDAQTK